MLRKGFSAVRDAKSKFDSHREIQAARWTPIFALKDGETVEGLWFNGDPEQEPLVYDEHSFRGSQTAFRSDPCAAGSEDHEGCVFCFAKQQGDRRVQPG